LLLVSSPLTENPVDFDRALSRLIDALAEVAAPASFQAMVAEPDAVAALLARRNRPAFHVLHYFGHGAQPDRALEGKLVFEDGTGGARGLTKAQLRAVLNPTNQPAPEFAVAVLTACHSESVAAALHDLGVRHIVAVDAEKWVTEVAAVAFFRRFYQVLLTGGAVREAFDAGCNAVKLDDDLLGRLSRAKAEAEADKFKLLPADVPHDEPLLIAGDGDGSAVVEPLPALTAAPFHQRPASFVGRADDLYAIIQRLKAHRAVLIQGVSGVGKTELAKETAHWLAARRWIRPEAGRFVALGNHHTADAARAAIALAVGVKPDALPDDAGAADAALAAAMPPGALLVLDEAENVIAQGGLAFRNLLEALVRSPARPLVVITSQSDVDSAHLPRYVLQRLDADPAVRLFVRTTKISAADLACLDRAALLELLGYLDGVPRAIELVAKQLSNSAGLKPLLEDVRRARDEIMHDKHYPDEVKSVTVGVRLAYERLLTRSTAAAVLYTLLPLFPGGVPAEGVAAIFGAEGRRLLPLIENESLLERPLPDLVYVPAPFRFFAERQLPGGLDAARTVFGPAALRFYFGFEEEPHRGWASQLNETLTRAGDAMGGVIGRYALELPSIEAWLDWGYRAEPCDVGRSRAARLTAQLENLYVVTGLLRFQAARLAAALASARRCNDQTGEANVRKALGDLALREADLAAARRHYEAALAIYPGIGDRLGEANVRKGLGNLALAQNDPQEAFTSYRAALEAHQAIGDRLGMGADLGYMARAARAAGAGEQAVLLDAEAVNTFRSIGDQLGQALALNDQGRAFWAAENQQAALAAWWQAREIAHRIDMSLARKLDGLFAQVAGQAGAAQYAQLEAGLRDHAEAWRQEGIAAARRALEGAANAPSGATE
jgi:tetratricopeptide (TPR) repeat protein